MAHTGKHRQDKPRSGNGKTTQPLTIVEEHSMKLDFVNSCIATYPNCQQVKLTATQWHILEYLVEKRINGTLGEWTEEKELIKLKKKRSSTKKPKDPQPTPKHVDKKDETKAVKRHIYNINHKFSKIHSCKKIIESHPYKGYRIAVCKPTTRSHTQPLKS